MHKPGDKVEVETTDGVFTGIIMPNENANTLFLKLSSGYNVGIEKKKIKQIEVLEQFKETAKEKKAEIKDNKNLPTISILHTGGTIASQVDYRTGAVVSKFTPEDLLRMFPELHEIANIKSRMIFQMFSEDMEPEHWSILAKEVNEEIKKGVDGVIITHGTDTMGYSSAALSFALQNLPIPVILVGAQRSSDRPSSDAALNIIAATKFISKSDFSGVAVCMHKNENDTICLIHSGTNVRKMHTSRRDAFRSINEMPLAKFWSDGKVDILNKNHKKRNNDEKVIADVKFEPKIALLKAYPGSEPEILEILAKKGYKGFVIEGTGMGHVPTEAEKTWIPSIKKLIKDGIPVVIAPQTIYGRINTDVYTNLRVLYHEAKAIPAEDMLPEVAYIKLGWILGHTNDFEEVRKMMFTNISGEITARSEIDNFLV